MDLAVYGSFNCPYSFLAALRARRLVADGTARLAWQAVVHDPEVPPEGVPLSGEHAEALDRELEEIRGLLKPGEPYAARRPPVQPDTTAAVAGYCSLQGEAAQALCAALFEAFWVDGADIGSRGVLDRLGCPAAAPGDTMARWESEWRGFGRSVVPTLVLPGGKVFPGLEALARLADLESRSGARAKGRR